MDKEIEVGKLAKVVTKDGRTFLGTITGYAEVATGDEVIEEIYVQGFGELRLLGLNDIEDIDQEDVSFRFRKR